MKILWFINKPPAFFLDNSAYNGGGWLTSLEQMFHDAQEHELGIAFFYESKDFKIVKGTTSYYPLPSHRLGFSQKLSSIFGAKEKTERGQWPKYTASFENVIHDFNPDIIEVFGSELQFGLISRQINVPVVLHIQGVLNPYFNAFLPPSFSWKDFILRSYNPKVIVDAVSFYDRWQRDCFREREILRDVRYFIGRTDWDKKISRLFSPDSKYYWGGEILREQFYEFTKRNNIGKLTICSTISNPLYKGYDLILKTAKVLKQQSNIDFDWIVFGNINPQFTENKLGIESSEVNVVLKGVASAEAIKSMLVNSTVYVHTSYIDNSPNSICEAQILGVPIIASNVGGVSSLIENGKTGILVPANDPFLLASEIISLYSQKSLNENIGNLAREVALKRHDKDAIFNSLIKTYIEIIDDFNNKQK